jgi:predicted DNA-binding protein
MSIQLTPEHEARINELARQTGRNNTEVLGDVIDSYFEELARINATLDRRYDEIKSGQVKPISADEVLERLQRRSEERRARG